MSEAITDLQQYQSSEPIDYEVLDIQLPKEADEELNNFRFLKHTKLNLYRFVCYDEDNDEITDDLCGYYMIHWYFGIQQGLMEETIDVYDSIDDDLFRTMTMDIPKMEEALANLGYDINPPAKSATKN